MDTNSGIHFFGMRSLLFFKGILSVNSWYYSYFDYKNATAQYRNINFLILLLIHLMIVDGGDFQNVFADIRSYSL